MYKCSCPFPTVFVQIATDGLISVGESYMDTDGARFPIPHRVIAPYWDNIDMREQGRIEYYESSDSNHSALRQVNAYFNERTDVSFQASWILVVQWIDCCSLGDEKCINESINVSGRFVHA